MTVPEPEGTRNCRHTGVAFGLHIDCDWPLPGTSPSVPGGFSLGERSVRVFEALPEMLADAWSAEYKLLHENRFADGTEWLTVKQGSSGYMFEIRGYGRHLIAPDGRSICCEYDSAPRSQHQRFIMSYGLPMAAALQGCEVLHASAVAQNDMAVAFAGPSGMGKTTLASQLILRGAQLVSDDVLALEREDEDLLAHPGPPFLAVVARDAEAITDPARRLGERLGSSDKVHFSPNSYGGRLPLRLLYHLESGPRFEITPIGGEERVGLALRLAFLPFLMTPQRLQRHLEVAQVLSVHVAQFRLTSPHSGVDSALLSALEAHIKSHLR